MVLTAGGAGGRDAASSGGVAVAAGTTASSYLDGADDREARDTGAALSNLGGGRRAAGAAVNMAATGSPYSGSGEDSVDPPLPVFRQSVSSTLTGPGSGSLMNGNGNNNGSSLYGGAGKAVAIGGGSAAAAKGQTGTASRGGATAAAGLAAAAGKQERDMKPARGLPGGGKTTAGGPTASITTLQNSSMRTRVGLTGGGAAAGVSPAPGGRALTTGAAAGGGGRVVAVPGGAAAAAANERDKTSGTSAAATTGGRGSWTTLFRSGSRESHGGDAAEHRSLLRNSSAGGAARPAAAAGGRHDGSGGPAAAPLTSGRGRGSTAASALRPMDQQESLMPQNQPGKEKKAKQWIIASLLMYFFLGILVLYCVSYANIEWCCIFVIFGVVIGGMGLAGLRKSSRLLLLIHVGAAAVLLFTLFVAWCYNIYVLLRAIEILVASSWPPIQHQQFRYYYSIPTAYESPPAPWVEEVLLMRLQYPSEDADGIRKLIGKHPEQQQGGSSNGGRRRRKREATRSEIRSGSKDTATAPAAAGSRRGRQGEVDAAGGKAEGGGAKTQTGLERRATAQPGADKAAAATTRAASSRGRRLESGDEEARPAAAAEERGEAALAWERPRENASPRERDTQGDMSIALGWGRRLAEMKQEEKWRGDGGHRERRLVSTWLKDSSRGALTRRLVDKPAVAPAAAAPVAAAPVAAAPAAAAAAQGIPFTQQQRGDRRGAAPRRQPLRRPAGVGDRGAVPAEAGERKEILSASDADRVQRPAAPRSAGPSSGAGAGPAHAAVSPPLLRAGSPPTAAASASAATAAARSSPDRAEEAVSSPLEEGTQQQLRGRSGPAQQLLQEEEEEEAEEEEEERQRQRMARASSSHRYERRPRPASLSSTLSLAAARTSGREDDNEQTSFTERDEKARRIIKGCVEGANRNPSFLNEASHAMSSLAARGWLCAFARAEIFPFHRWPVDCKKECGYAFLDAGHDLHASNYYDMTRVAEYLIQISSLSPKRMQQCVDYAAATVCSIENRNFFVVWVVLLLLWLLFACIACTGIMPLSLYNTVQVIKTMQQP